MRTKHIFKVLALVLCIGAFALPTTAFATGGKDTVPPSLEASLTDGKVQIEARMIIPAWRQFILMKTASIPLRMGKPL